MIPFARTFGPPSMRTPFFEELCAEIRGIDLGDDGLLREGLAARIREGNVDAESWLLFAVLCARGDDPQGGLEALVHARAAGTPKGTVAFLRAHLHAERGEYPHAATELTAAASAGDDAVANADIEHARGALAWRRGDLEGALLHFRGGLDDDPHDALRWLDYGCALASAGRHEEADRAFGHAIDQDEELDLAHYERASLWLSRQRVAEAATTLALLVERNPGLRERARVDARWRGVRAHPAVTSVLSPPTAPAAWIPRAPRWLTTLIKDPAHAGWDVAWLDAKASTALGERLVEAHARAAPGTMHTPATLAFAQELLRDCIVIGRGPNLYGRERTTAPVLWLFDRRRDALCMAPSPSYPAFLWIPAGRDTDGMRRALASLVPQPFPSRAELTARARGFVGYRLQFGVPSPYSGELEPANAAELDRHFALNPFVEPGAWGSSRIDDPWPNQMPAQPQLQLRMATREQVVTAQTPGRVWSISRRTRHSRSILSIELHHRDIFVAEVRYQPSPHTEVIEAFNARFGSDYPTDLPVDALGALLGFRFESAADLEAQLRPDADPAIAAGVLHVISALRHDDLSVTALYRRWLEHDDPVVRSTLYNVFVAHNHESLLEEACITESDTELRAQIEGVLDDGIAPIQWDPYRDYATGDEPEQDES